MPVFLDVWLFHPVFTPALTTPHTCASHACAPTRDGGLTAVDPMYSLVVCCLFSVRDLGAQARPTVPEGGKGLGGSGNIFETRAQIAISTRRSLVAPVFVDGDPE